MSTGQIFFIGGIVGMIAVTIISVILFCTLHTQGKKLRTQIWKEYK